MNNEEAYETADIGSTSLADSMSNRERRTYIKRAMQYLISEDVSVLSFFYLEELSIKEVAN